MKAREVKRAKLVAKYAEKRAALKQIVRTGDPADAFEAAQKLQMTVFLRQLLRRPPEADHMHRYPNCGPRYFV